MVEFLEDISQHSGLILGLLGVFVPATVTFAALYFREALLRKRERWQRSESLQPMINELTVKLGELSEQTQDLIERQWEYPFEELSVSEEDVRWFEERFGKASEISKDAARSLRDLVKFMRKAIEEMERKDEIVRYRALELMGLSLLEPEASDDKYGEYIMLVGNQEYHFWSEHLYSIGDGIWQFAKSLHPHAARKDTQKDLSSMGLLRPKGLKKLFGKKYEPRLGDRYSPEGI